MRSKAAPVTPTAIAVVFGDLPGFVADKSIGVSDEESAAVGEGEGEIEGFVGERNVGDWLRLFESRVVLVRVVEGSWKGVLLVLPLANEGLGSSWVGEENVKINGLCGLQQTAMSSSLFCLSFPLTQSGQVPWEV